MGSISTLVKNLRVNLFRGYFSSRIGKNSTDEVLGYYEGGKSVRKKTMVVIIQLYQKPDVGWLHNQ